MSTQHSPLTAFYQVSTTEGVKFRNPGVNYGTTSDEDGAILDRCNKGSISVTLSGPWAANQVATWKYSVLGNTVTLRIPASTSAVNAANAATTTLPSYLRPAAQQIVPITVVSNAVLVVGLMDIQTNGTVLIGTAGAGAPGAFTNAAVGGPTLSTVTYSLV